MQIKEVAHLGPGLHEADSRGHLWVQGQGNGGRECTVILRYLEMSIIKIHMWLAIISHQFSLMSQSRTSPLRYKGKNGHIVITKCTHIEMHTSHSSLNPRISNLLLPFTELLPFCEYTSVHQLSELSHWIIKQLN